MRYTFTVWLLLIALLVGCAAPSPSREETTAEPVPETTTVSVPETTTVPETEPPMTPPEGEALPSSGLQVQTNFSQYAPREEEIQCYTRLQETWMADLQPRQDYGAIYPYAGSTLWTQFLDSVYRSGYLYGIVDQSGRIVTDPVYSGVDLLSYYTEWEHLYGRYDGHPLPFYDLSKTLQDDSGRVWTYHAIASEDGSFVTDCVYTSLSAYPDCIIGYFYDGDFWGEPLAYEDSWDSPIRFHVYNLEGELILRSEDLPYAGQLASFPHAFRSSNQGFTAALKDQENPDACNYYYTDIEGRLLHGPYYTAGAYYDGLAMVQTEWEVSRYVDAQGQFLDTRSWADATAFHLGTAQVRDSAGTEHILCSDGTILFTLPEETWVTRTEEGYLLCNSYGVSYERRDLEGNVIETLITGPDQYYHINLTFVEDYRNHCLIHRATDKKLTFPESAYVDFFQEVSGSPELQYIAVTDWRSDGLPDYQLYDYDFNLLAEGKGYVFTQTIGQDNKWALCIRGEKELLLVKDGEFLPLPLQADQGLEFYADRILCITENACAYYDYEGNLLFRKLLSGQGLD